MKKAKSNFSKFMLLWTGELLSQIGGGLTSFGLGVYVFSATGSAAQMALVTLLGFLPTLLLSVPAGVLADMHDRRVLMMIGDGLSALGPLFILLCMMTGEAKLWQICIGVFVSAVFSALLEPSYRATITDLLTKEEFTRANGLTSLAGSARYLVSPMLAGVLLSVSDVKLLLIIDICTFFITVMATAVVKQGLSEEQDLVEEQSPAEKQSLSEEQRVAEKQEIVLTKSLAGVDEPNWKTPSGKRFAGKLKEGWNAIYSRKGVFFLIMISSVMTMFMGVIQILCEPMILSFADAGTLGTTETVSALVCGHLYGSFFAEGKYLFHLRGGLFVFCHASPCQFLPGLPCQNQYPGGAAGQGLGIHRLPLSTWLYPGVCARRCPCGFFGKGIGNLRGQGLRFGDRHVWGTYDTDCSWFSFLQKHSGVGRYLGGKITFPTCFFGEPCYNTFI